MPIDLISYTKSIRDALKRGGFACVYVVSAGDVCRLGYSEEMAATASRMQRSSPVSLAVESLLWVPNRAIATTIARAAQCDLAEQRHPNNWFAVSATVACHAVDLVAFRLYPGATMINHDELMSHWSRKKAAA
jgi:hypothetical protein